MPGSHREPSRGDLAELDAELRRSEERYRSLAESATDAIVTADERGLITYANAAAHRLFGRAGEELLGRPLTVLMPERYRAAHTAAFTRVVASAQPTVVGTVRSLVGEDADGREIPLEATFGMWRAGDTVGFSGILRDVTERQLQDRATELVRQALMATSGAPNLNAAVEGLAVALAAAVTFDRLSYVVRTHDDVFELAAVWGPDGWRFSRGETVVVDAPDRLTAMRRDGLLRRHDTHEQGDDPVPLDALDAELAHRGIRSYISVPVVAGGRLSAMLNVSRSTPGAFDEPTSELVARVVRATSGALHTLELLQRERAVAERLRELDQLKNDFVGMVAHDLRTPMTVIGGYADLLTSQWDRFPDAERKQHLDAISRNVRGLSGLVDDILHVVRLESGVVSQDLAPTDLSAIVARAVAEARIAYPDHEFVLSSPDHLPLAVADADRQAQVLGNLLSNAAKFGGTGAPIDVRVSDQGDELRVSVGDHGPGIRPEDLPKLFQRFSRIAPPESASPVKGTGLGLYICRLLVESQGGTIDVQSEPGVGSTFSYTVPVAAGAANPPEPAPLDR